MKKIFSLMIVLAAVAMVSCCGNKKTNAEAETVATEVVDEAAASCCEKKDSCCGEKCDSCTCTEKCDSCTCGDKCEAAAEAPAEEAK